MSEQSAAGEGGLASKICLCPGVGRFYRRRGPAPRALPLPDPRLPAQRGDTPLSRARPTLHPAWAGLGGLGPPPVAQAFAGARREGLPGPSCGSSLQSPLGAAACAADVCAPSGCVCSRARSCVCLRASLCLCGAAWPPSPAFLEFPKLYVGATPFWAAPPLPAGLHVVTREPHLQPRLQTFSPGFFPA